MPASSVTSTPTTTIAAPQNTNYRAMAMVTTLFFMWGFLTCLNDILIPHLKSIFDLNYAEVMLVQFAFFSSYFVFSFPSGKIIDFFGYKKAMVSGLVTMGVAALMFVPAAQVVNRPPISIGLVGGKPTITYGGTLLFSPNAAGPYNPVSGAVSPYTVPAGAAAGFYRSQQ